MHDDVAGRAEAWIEKSLAAPATNTFSELLRLHQGVEPDAGVLERELAMLDAREDCADFQAAGFVRMVHQCWDSAVLNDRLKEKVKRTLLHFKYWPDEPGDDSMCSWTENHTILFASAAYLAGQKFPTELFVNSLMTGRELIDRFLPRIRLWLELRFSTGFSEWLSNVYYNEDIPALLNLVDFAEDESLRLQAEMVMDLLLVDLALNSFHGVFASTHGRSYENAKKQADRESTAPIARLLFGGETFGAGNFSAISLILSSYSPPPIVVEMAQSHTRGETETRQTNGIDIRDRETHGLDSRDPDHGMMLLATEAYMHPGFVSSFLTLLDSYRWWDNSFFAPLRPFRLLLKALRALGLLRPAARMLEKDISRGYRGIAHTYSFRTPEYMMSSAQNYRVGYGGDQQSPWQVTLGDNATCFITHPGKQASSGKTTTPNYWTGSGTQPAVAQYRNCAIMIYRINTAPGLYVTNRQLITHAWFPIREFDQVVAEGHWLFAARGAGYVGLWSMMETEWGDEEDGRCDLIAPGEQNVWICQAGSQAESGSFDCFRENLLQADLHTRRLGVSFDSPGNGKLCFQWKGDLTLNGTKIPLHERVRYKSQFGTSPYPARKIEFRSDRSFLVLDYDAGRRDFGHQEEPQ